MISQVSITRWVTRLPGSLRLRRLCHLTCPPPPINHGSATPTQPTMTSCWFFSNSPSNLNRGLLNVYNILVITIEIGVSIYLYHYLSLSNTHFLRRAIHNKLMANNSHNALWCTLRHGDVMVTDKPSALYTNTGLANISDRLTSIKSFLGLQKSMPCIKSIQTIPF